MQTVVRASLIALALTPSIYYHGTILPAIAIAFFLDGKDKLIAIVPIIVVWLIVMAILTVRSKRQAIGSARVDPG